MLVLKVNHNKTFILNADKNDLEVIREFLTVFKKRFQLSPFAEEEWEVTHLLNLKDFSFPTAYLDELKKYCDEKNILTSINDNRKYPLFTIPKLALKKELNLRDDQNNAFSKIREEKTGIIMMPTASGKSRVIFRTIDFRKVRTLIIVPKTNLQTQMSKELRSLFGNSRIDTLIPLELKEKMKLGLIRDENEEFDEDHILRKKSIKIDDDIFVSKEKTSKKSMFDEVISTSPKKVKFSMDMSAISSDEDNQESPEDLYLKNKKKTKFEKIKEKQEEKYKNSFNKFKEKKIKYKDIYVICDASLDKLPQEFFNQIEMVIIDECHHSAAKLIREALLKMKNAAYRYFFSATPWRDHPAEEKLLAASIGTKIIFELSPEDAIKFQSIAKPELIMENSPDPKNFIQDKKQWREVLETGIIGNETRNKKIVEDALKDLEQERNVFIAVDEISHLEILKERFQKQGIEVETIHGEQPRKLNESIIEKVGKRKSGICIGTMSVGEGTDMPNIDSVILASGGKSSIRFLQRIGRGARKGTEQDKVSFIVRDYFDWFNPKLMRHSLKRKDIFKQYYKEFGE